MTPVEWESATWRAIVGHDGEGLYFETDTILAILFWPGRLGDGIDYRPQIGQDGAVGG